MSLAVAQRDARFEGVCGQMMMKPGGEGDSSLVQCPGQQSERLARHAILYGRFLSDYLNLSASAFRPGLAVGAADEF